MQLAPPWHPPTYPPTHPPTSPSNPVQGHIVAASPTFSHTLPHVFKQPGQYQPDRFAAPREEDKAMNLSYLGFGGGRHACMVRRGHTCGGGGLCAGRGGGGGAAHTGCPSRQNSRQ